MDEKEKWKNKCIQCAKKYNANLINKNLLFIYQDSQTNKVSYIETKFFKHNFLHMTGLSYKGSANDFFDSCVNQKLSTNDIYINNKQSPYRVNLKLDVLETILNLDKAAKIIGDFNHSGENLNIDVAIGNHVCSLGLGYDNNDKQFFPKSVLNGNINTIITQSNNILAIASKNINNQEKKYSNLTYINKNCSINELFTNITLDNVINWENLYSTSQKYQNKIDNFKTENNKIKEYNAIYELYDFLGFDIDEKNIEEELDNGTLLNFKYNSEECFYYYDGNKEAIINIISSEIITDNQTINKMLLNTENDNLLSQTKDEEEL